VAGPDSHVYSLRLRDKFGDSGLTGVAILRMDGDTAVIDSFLLSCRILGKTVETAFLGFLCEQAIRAGATRVLGRFLPTPKNAPASEFYPKHGFTRLQAADRGGESWVRDLKVHGPVPIPPWITVSAGQNSP
jgi:FkbH-like protein